MNEILKAAMRKEAFVQGYIRAMADSLGRKLADVPDETILSWLPSADEAFKAYRAERDTP